jgi:hypothetical protein
LGEAIEIDRLNILVDQGNRVAFGGQCGKQGQRRDRQIGPFPR